MAIIVAPSILSADHARLADEIKAVEAAGADWLHLDVMDGHFVPNLTFGPPVIKSLRKVTALPFDVHLMIENPERSIDQYREAGADFITVHAEASVHLHRTLGHIRELGARPGVSLNPATPVSALHHVLEMVDVVLVMSVNPGFGGQKFIPSSLLRISELARIKIQHGLKFHLEVDGGISAQTIRRVTDAGADAIVAGSAIFGQKDYSRSVADLRLNASSHS